MARLGAHARTIAAMVTVVAALGAGKPPGHAAPSPAAQVPRLAISISDGQVAVRTGQTLGYTIRLLNTGTVAVVRLQVSQTLSPGLVAGSASDGGTWSGRRVTWTTDLPAGATRTFRVTARVVSAPARELRLSAVACAALPGSRQPIVCAAHLDRLPVAGPGLATRARAVLATWARTSLALLARPGLLLPVAAGLLLLAGCLAALLLGRRGRRRRGPPPRPGSRKARGRHAAVDGHSEEAGNERGNSSTLNTGT